MGVSLQAMWNQVRFYQQAVARRATRPPIRLDHRDGPLVQVGLGG
jgi:hypothetical protein